MKHPSLKFDFSPTTFQLILEDLWDWWSIEMIDNRYGGFLGRIGGDGTKYPEADKSIILNTRILWSFSRGIRFGFRKCTPIAHRAFSYINVHFQDREHGGYYWMLTANGMQGNTRKQIYAQAFAIYAFTEYYMACEFTPALNKALELFSIIEERAKDKERGGYYEAFSKEWQSIEDVRLSPKDANDVKTMNTHLHLLEAYTNLYRCHKTAETRIALENLIHLYCDHFMDIEEGRLKLFFDEDWKENKTHHSFGHEIESAWLLNEAAEVLNQKSVLEKVRKGTAILVDRVYKEGIAPNGGIYNERNLDGHFDQYQDWWPQTEAVIGFYDAYQKTNNEQFLNASENCLDFIIDKMIDYDKGEWFWSVDLNGNPNILEDKAGPWKAPYHNTRMCFEMIDRLNKSLI